MASKLPATPFQAKCSYPYEAEQKGELSIRLNEKLLIRDKNEDGWALAVRPNGETGWVPLDFLDAISESVVTKPPKVHRASVVKPKAEAETKKKSSGSRDRLCADPRTEGGRGKKKSSGGRDRLCADPRTEGGRGKGVGVKATVTGPTKVEIREMGEEKAVPAVQNTAAGKGEKDKKMMEQVLQATEKLANLTCWGCKEKILKNDAVFAKDKTFHPEHFTCAKCGEDMKNDPFVDKDDKFYHENCYYEAFNPRCGHCNKVIMGPYVTAIGKTWHPDHFVCTACKKPFESSEFRRKDDMPYCETCYAEEFGTKCFKCGELIKARVVQAMGKKYHAKCFGCVARST